MVWWWFGDELSSEGDLKASAEMIEGYCDCTGWCGWSAAGRHDGEVTVVVGWCGRPWTKVNKAIRKYKLKIE